MRLFDAKKNKIFYAARQYIILRGRISLLDVAGWLMAGYIKNIAVLRGMASGFSADGGALSGLVKAEKYGSFFRAEISLINFAPPESGRYVAAVSDGERTVAFDVPRFEGESGIDISFGFAALVCFVGAEVVPVASAVCGDLSRAVAVCSRYVESTEKPGSGASASRYEDEAIAEENYYEYGEDIKSEGAVCGGKEQEDGRGVCKDEDARAVCLGREETPDMRHGSRGTDPGEGGAPARGGAGEDGRADGAAGGEADLSRKPNFFGRVREEIERLLSEYPPERGLEGAVENSRWAKISYGEKRHYVFGVIYEGASPAYVCYGVPSDGGACPESLRGMASFIPAGGKNAGYWVMYQDAETGAAVKLCDG